LASGEATPARASAALAAWEKIDSVLALGQVDASEVPAELQILLEEREAARKARDFKKADVMRDELKAKGWTIEDTPKGARLKKL
jgi:cysteinyl-tRNA synthetase